MAYARLPSGSQIALGNRHPMSVDLQHDIARDAIVAVKFNLAFDCELGEATVVYARLLNGPENDVVHWLGG